MDTYWDVVVIGSGLGGLSAALSLSETGRRVLILEKSTAPGGCASSFQKNGFIFESGATTLVGFEPGLPLDKLTREFQIQFPLLPLKRSMVVHLDGKIIERYQNHKNWILEAKRMFGGGLRMEVFWKLSNLLSDSLWSLSGRYKFFPFQKLIDIWKSIGSFRPSDLLVLFFSFVPLRIVLKCLGLTKNKEWIRFLDEQLLITSQTTSAKVSMSFASIGLTYPQLQNYVLKGGMVSLAETILEKIESKGGKILYKQEVCLLKKISSKNENQEMYWEIHTKHRENFLFRTPLVVSNLPIWNLMEITDTLPKLKEKTKKIEKGIWGAFTMGIAIQTNPSEEWTRSECLHHQIHLKKSLPYGGGNSLFLSLSHPEDSIRSSDGIRILSLSTHIENPESWVRDDLYLDKKKTIESILIQTLEESFSWFHRDKILFQHSATPVTWKTWTGRKFGRVGGIPNSYFSNPFQMLSNRSEDPNLLLTGDTVYPGQGIPAVVLGGLHSVEQFLARKRG
ncbi:phytoene desaturase family protein [Leptospira bandrabouensis]|uniref:phytoene desaturase family protein n=1 Tax=Leptospira bandrabouensis TaxID=2484903 RepID=UPI001EE7BFE9|nr:NAD(P)/FAD-dependent oxidoreductase [Leptospira bandrabouensis]MCG6142901.1 NAD(P)/FAD-dependent oxidoreductase [Leptospira bandrabouensis]MCG6162496.1 NAD(P)/FAD-dependent oxidoreductase [Leptospira bandrabouensis]